MKLLKNIFITAISTFLFIIFPFVVFTLVTSRTPFIYTIRSFVVLSGSMTPIFPVGSIVYTHPQTTYKIGEVITYKNNGGENVTHRIIAKKNQEYITQGDANTTPDSNSVSQKQITGKVFFFVPYVGYLINSLKSPAYFLGFIILPAIIFIMIELWNIKKEIERATEKRVLERLQKQS